MATPPADRSEARPSGERALSLLGADPTTTSAPSARTRLHAEAPLPPGRGRVQPVIVEGAVSPDAAPGVTAPDLARLRGRLVAGDRAGVYLELYRLTGQEIWLMHAQITSYTGVFGGAAITANFLAKTGNPDKYHVALDTFSRQIAASMLDVVERDVAAGGQGKVEVATLRKEGDWGVWDAKGMGGQFPGNGLFVELWHHGLDGLPHVFSQGTLYGLEAIIKGAGHGKRPSEFKDHPRYDVQDSKDARFVTVIDKKTGKVEAFFDKQAAVVGTFGQIADQPLSPADQAWHTRAALWEYMQANQDAERTLDPRLLGAGPVIPQPSLPGFAADHGLLDRQLFRNPSDGVWYHGGTGAPVEEAPVLERLRTLRAEALAERRARGLPDEPALPDRYRAAALFDRPTTR